MSLHLVLACAAVLFPMRSFVDGFAAWLAEGAKCYTDLLPGEVIMNAAVVPHSESTHPDIALHVYSATEEGGMIMEPTRRRIHNDVYHYVYEQEGPRADYVLKLHIPPSAASSLGGDLQYVVDVSESSPATFFGGNRGCDNRRAYGKPKVDAVRLRIDFDGEAADEVDPGEEVVVWAGWATGHEAVQLTESVVFRRKKREENNKDTVEAPEDAGRARAAAAAALIEDYEGGGKSKSSSDGANYAQERLDEMRRTVHHVDGGHDSQRVVEDQVGQKRKKKNNDGDDDDGGDGGSRRSAATKKKSRDLPKMQTQNDDKTKTKPYVPSGPRPTEKDDETNFGTFRRKYNKHELGLQQFSMAGYLLGCALLAAMGLVLARYSELAGRRLHKGSRLL